MGQSWLLSQKVTEWPPGAGTGSGAGVVRHRGQREQWGLLVTESCPGRCSGRGQPVTSVSVLPCSSSGPGSVMSGVVGETQTDLQFPA